MKVIINFVLLSVLPLISGQSKVLPWTGMPCQKSSSLEVNCDTIYECDNDVHAWKPIGKCVLGYVFNPQTKICELSNSTSCPEISRPILPRRIRRFKRQANRDCSAAFDCPRTLAVPFPYPDWQNCENFYVCDSGQIQQGSCSDFGFRYYNPNRYDCENVQSDDNICLSQQR